MSAPRNRLLIGDAHARLRTLDAASVDQVLTSPPYFRLRHYDAPDQLGQEVAVDAWVEALLEVTQELGRVLTPTGTLWLNLGDSYALHPRQGAPRKSLLLGPERLALRLIAGGWQLRNKIVWRKANPMPTSVRDRLTCSWEYLYVFARSKRYFFDLDAIRQPHATTPPKGASRARSASAETWRGSNSASRLGLAGLLAAGRVGHPLGRNPGDVWTLASANYRGPHPATFPLRLARTAVQVGCPERRCSQCRAPWQRSVLRAASGSVQRSRLAPSCDCNSAALPGLVLDPFMGAGTTALAAEALNRDWLGVEISQVYAAEALARIKRARAGPAAA